MEFIGYLCTNTLSRTYNSYRGHYQQMQSGCCVRGVHWCTFPLFSLLPPHALSFTSLPLQKSLISAEELLRYCTAAIVANPNTRSPPSEPPTSESQTKSHFQAPQLPSSAGALTRVILSSSPGLRGNRPVLCSAVSDMTPEMEMKPWIFIRRGRCPQRPSPGEEAGGGGSTVTK